jgi:hypothetical protein
MHERLYHIPAGSQPIGSCRGCLVEGNYEVMALLLIVSLCGFPLTACVGPISLHQAG